MFFSKTVEQVLQSKIDGLNWRVENLRDMLEQERRERQRVETNLCELLDYLGLEFQHQPQHWRLVKKGKAK